MDIAMVSGAEDEPASVLGEQIADGGLETSLSGVYFRLAGA
ncbi:hypothetical protein [Amycolatopsis coloradensis]|nr:hypothetical protein [Amycolatopsis coloradensis]